MSRRHPKHVESTYPRTPKDVFFFPLDDDGVRRLEARRATKRLEAPWRPSGRPLDRSSQRRRPGRLGSPGMTTNDPELTYGVLYQNE